jgi:hypothetical protein
MQRFRRAVVPLSDVGRVSPTTVRLPRPLRAQLVALARAEDRSASSVVVPLRDQAVAVRAKKRRLVAVLVERLRSSGWRALQPEQDSPSSVVFEPGPPRARPSHR